MTGAPERIWLHVRRMDAYYDEGDGDVPYILATPEAIAASPEVKALIAEARREGWNAAKAEGLDANTLCKCGMSGPCMWDQCEHPILAMKETTHD